MNSGPWVLQFKLHNLAYTTNALSFSCFPFFGNVVLADFHSSSSSQLRICFIHYKLPLSFMSMFSQKKNCTYSVLLTFQIEFYISFTGRYTLFYFCLTHKMMLGTSRHSINTHRILNNVCASIQWNSWKILCYFSPFFFHHCNIQFNFRSLPMRSGF